MKETSREILTIMQHGTFNLFGGVAETLLQTSINEEQVTKFICLHNDEPTH